MKIYIGNLSAEINEHQLRQLFQIFGQVQSVVIIRDKFTHGSRGFGYVRMPNKEAALQAISKLDGKKLRGRKLKVNQARHKSRGFSGRERRCKCAPWDTETFIKI
ncbi:MAG: RNA-binding protein [candidate division Zixibacteria bacterium]|nr:RNA-binding protein [candidate division Zixibacteria bacterium]NIW41425.1 RNA-binding protein [candidate division Zixibacteria bacterium]NIW97313.1 RNA-binding protein [Phycisphaerae bacterium]